MRLAVGASRGRLVRQLITESLLISLAGGAAGIGLAAFINHAVSSLQLPTDFALVFDLRTDWRVLVFTLVLSIATGIFFSLIPALQSSKPQLVPALKDESSMGGFRRSRLRNGLVVVQVSLSLVLLISAALIVRGLQAAQKVRPGFIPENRVALSFDVTLQGYDEARGRAFYNQVLERARAVPQVELAAFTDNLPLGLNYNSSGVYIEGAEFTSVSNFPIAVPYHREPRLFRCHGHSVARPRFSDGRKQDGIARRDRERDFRAPLLSRAGGDRQTLQFPWAERSASGKSSASCRTGNTTR